MESPPELGDLGGVRVFDLAFQTPSQQIFDEYPNAVTYQNIELQLENVYRDMATKLEWDGDIQSHFTKAVKRIAHCQELDCTDRVQLSASWQQQLTAIAILSDSLV